MAPGKRYCCFGPCNSYSKVGAPGYDPSVKFYKFPQPCLLLRNNILTWSNEEELLHIETCEKCQLVQRWMGCCKRNDERFRRVRQISDNFFICSKHFEEKPEKLNYYTCLPTSNSKMVTERRRKRLRAGPSQATLSANLNTSDVCSGTENEQLHRAVSVSNKEGECSMGPEDDRDDGISTPGVSGYQSTELTGAKKSVGTQTIMDFPLVDQYALVIERLENQVKEIQLKLSEAEKSTAEAQKARAESRLPLVIFEQQLETNEGMCKFYTGFNTEQLKAVRMFAAVDKVSYWGDPSMNEADEPESPSSTQCRTRNYTPAQELLLFFMRMRGGFLLEDIGYRFNLPPSYISRMVSKWTRILYEKFNCVRSPMFSPRHLIQKHLPAIFKKFKNLRVIIDCAEIRCENPSSFEQRGNCYSECEAHTTYKFLIGCTPNGGVSFVSDLLEGSIDDRAIVVESGLVELLEEGDLVLADRGFTVRDLVGRKGAVSKIPAFIKGRDSLTPREEMETREVAANRIFIEHVVGRLQNFRIFQGVIPLSMRTQLSQSVFVCACLLNFHEPLIE